MKTSKINFIASVKEENAKDIKNIAKNLKQMGCNIDNVLLFSGVITGSTTSDMSLDDLKIAGIKNIESDRNITAKNK